MSKSKRPTVLVKRATVCGTPYGTYMVLVKKRPATAICCATGLTVTLLCNNYKVQKGVSLPVSWQVMNNIIQHKQTQLHHKIDRNYNDRLFNNDYTYVMLYDCFGRNLFFEIDYAAKCMVLGEPTIKLTLGRLIYEKQKP